MKRKQTVLELTRLAELKRIQSAHNGMLHPSDVVEYASNPKTALYSAFEWSDTVAARKYRLEQARNLIRVTVEIVSRKTGDISVSAFVALREDRKGDGGYRYAPALIKSKSGRAAMLDTALWELRMFQQKYAELKELCGVFEAIRKTEQNAKK